MPGRPKILKPVHPINRDGSQLSGVGNRNFGNQLDAGYMSSGQQIFNSGYVSQGGNSDNESARLSNVNTFKYNGINGSATKLEKMGTITSAIRKVSPNGIAGAGPIGGNHSINNGTMDYSSANENQQFNNQNRALP